MQHRASFYEKYIKRALDILLSGCAIIVLCPVMAITALFVLLRLGRPVIFSQERPGKHGRIFRLYKFRTMRDIYDESGVLLPDEERLTPFGRALRSTSLDELPAQANGRNSLTWEEKFEMDIYYVEHISFLLDVKIILHTLKAVFCRSGISSDTSATMEESVAY